MVKVSDEIENFDNWDNKLKGDETTLSLVKTNLIALHRTGLPELRCYQLYKRLSSEKFHPSQSYY